MSLLARPPFNDSDWFRKDDDLRWQFGVQSKGNANFAWVQHFIHHLAPQGMAGFVLANGSMSSNQCGEGEIRKALIEADLVDCMVALPGQRYENWKTSMNTAAAPVPSPPQLERNSAATTPVQKCFFLNESDFEFSVRLRRIPRLKDDHKRHLN